jgi:hypothetical protein
VAPSKIDKESQRITENVREPSARAIATQAGVGIESTAISSDAGEKFDGMGKAIK